MLNIFTKMSTSLISLLLICARITASQNLYFDGFKVRDDELLKCDSNIEGIAFKLPEVPQCILPSTNSNSTAVFLTTFWKDASDHPIEAIECFMETFDNLVTSSGFGLYTPIRIQQNKKYEPMDSKICMTLNLTQQTPDGEKLTQLGNGFRGTTNNIFPEAKYIGRARQKNTNYYIADIMLTINPQNNVIEPIGAAPLRPCKIDDEHCPSQKGLIMWKKDLHKTCRVQVGRSTPCLKTDSFITCRETLTTITEYNQTEICGVPVAISTTGLIFASNISQELHPNINSSSAIIKLLHKQNPNKVQIMPYLDTGVVSTVQFGAHLEHVTMTVNQNFKSVIQDFHYNICQNNRIQLQTHLNEAKKGNVDGLIAGLIGDSSYRGKLAGDSISIWRCRKISTWYFLTNKLCTDEHPVNYIDDGIMKEGWIQAITHEILNEPTLVQCPGPRFIFKTKSGIHIDAHQRQIADHMQTFIDAGSSIMPNTTDFLALAPNNIYHGKLNTTGRRDPLLQALHNSLMLGVIYQKLQSSETTLDEQESDFLNDLINVIGNIIGHFFGAWQMFYKVLIAIVLVILLICISKIRILRVFVKFIIQTSFKGILLLISPFTNLFKKPKLQSIPQKPPPPYGWIYP